MKKNKGFTLIELLAVIVVLAIIALIATPIVMNTIKNSKKGAAERSGESYTKQVETAIMEYRMESGNTLPNGTYDINEDGNLIGNGLTTPLTIEMNGTKPNDGSIVIENGQVSTTGTSMKFGDYTVSYDSTKKTYVATEKVGNNVEVLCTAVTELSIQSVYDGDRGVFVQQQTGVLASAGNPYAYGVEYTCNVGDGERTFYVLEESGDNVSLILGTNLGDTVAWSSDGSNHKDEDESRQAVTAKAYLAGETSGWTKLDPSQISLPSAEQIATASGKTFNGSSSFPGLPTWLRSYTDNNSDGYWTSTPDASYSDSRYVWTVTNSGYLINFNSDADNYNGVRPVITISKAQLR